MDNELLTIDEVMNLTKLKRSTIQRYLARKRMPAPIKLSQSVSRWRKREIEEWIAKGCPDVSQEPVATTVPH